GDCDHRADAPSPWLPRSDDRVLADASSGLGSGSLLVGHEVIGGHYQQAADGLVDSHVVFVMGASHGRPPSRIPDNRVRARAIRDRTVPTGIARAVAISS